MKFIDANSSIQGKAFVDTSDGLNLRTGPGTLFDKIIPLENGRELSLHVRTSDKAWVGVSLANGLDGWVFSEYISTNYDLDLLPVTQLPIVPPLPAGEETHIEIANNVYTATGMNFPINSVVNSTISVKIPQKSMFFFSTRTDNDGSFYVSKRMPDRWTDGSLFHERFIDWVVSSDDGTVVVKGKFEYIID